MKDKFREQSVLIRKTFRNIDKDHSGALDMNEFKQVLRKIRSIKHFNRRRVMSSSNSSSHSCSMRTGHSL